MLYEGSEINGIFQIKGHRSPDEKFTFKMYNHYTEFTAIEMRKKFDMCYFFYKVRREYETSNVV